MRQSKEAQGQFQLARQIIAYVFERKHNKGYHLVETALADRFGVSRALVRASLKRPAYEKIVELRRNQDFFLLKSWDEIDGRVITVPPSIDDSLYRRVVWTGSAEKFQSASRKLL
jgi:DNA-binding FadR family transcriptional regulator